ncbi:MAG: UDP-3-O-acyl-N-acetylglucosamine deacetylase [Bacteroidales bacterium]|nr:UDP-3-O-acyl-N-acetylglucosamine deacetylase [Bacteroidales bacterium]
MERMDYQHTLSKEYEFSGKGLHTGKFATMIVKPAPVDYGIRFVRTDIDPDLEIEAVASNVTSTSRATTISNGEASVTTIEHLLSALTGMGVDNARVELDNVEVPVKDGSAKPYIDVMWKDGFRKQDAPRKYIQISEPIEIRKEETGAFIRIEPADEPSYDLTIDFNSKVIGTQSAHWDRSVVYAEEIGICRTFVFFHELEYLFSKDLVRGGDLSNAIVVVEHPVTDEQIERMAKLFNAPKLLVSEGYLSNVALRFPNELARHKLLDLIGDLRLSGGFLNAKVTAYKSGHSINTAAAAQIEALRKDR